MPSKPRAPLIRLPLATGLAGLAAALALAAPTPADACSPLAQGWFVRDIEPGPMESMPPDGAIVLDGAFEVPFDITPHLDAVQVVVTDADDEPVAGHLEWSPAGADLLWWPDAPLEPGQSYRLSMQVDDDSHLINVWIGDGHTVKVGDPRPRTPGALLDARATVSTRSIPGECLGFDSCGGCGDAESLSEEAVWGTTLVVDLPHGPYADARVARTALGSSPSEARAILERTAPHHLPGGGQVVLEEMAGAVAAWPHSTACAAVQVLDPVDGPVLDTVACFQAPLAAVGRTTPVFETHDAEAADGGCDAGAGGGAAWWMFAVLLGLGRRRRLTASLLALSGLALSGLALSGCGVPIPDAVDESDVCFSCHEAIELPPLQKSGPTPPPILGGTLAVQGDQAIAADPDRDRVVLADLDGGTVLAQHPAEGPFRVVTRADRAFVTLRDAGAVLVIALPSGHVLGRHPVCAAPRGIALAWDQLHVACAGGALVSLTADGRITRRLPLAPDLRDVVAADDLLHVSRFRQAELISLDREGAVVARRAPPTHDVLTSATPGAPTVAWRTLALPSGDVVMLHQRSRTDEIRTSQPGGYGSGFGFGGCGNGIVTPELTVFPRPGGEDVRPKTLGQLGGATVAVDLALVEGQLAVAAPGNRELFEWHSGIIDVDLEDESAWGDCLRVRRGLRHGGLAPKHTAIAEHRGRLVGLQLDTPVLSDFDGLALVELGGEAVVDTGRDLFHADVGQGVACASCHPEGGEDGHAWLFEGHGLRRTQELRGGLAGTAPFHWTGDLRDMQHLMDEVMTRRMGGPEMPPGYTAAMLGWIDAQPVETVDVIEPGDPTAGALLFADAVVGCAACHSGPRLADDQRYDVGTGGYFVTPTLLGIGRRGSLMHDGCGATLADRFDPACGGGDAHGRTSHLSADELQDLIAYLATL